jgi:acetyl-CoA carboxylase biotin carboxylase subunit
VQDLRRRPGDVRLAPVNGHAIECRIYAEDPETFVPSPGKLEEFEIPEGDCLRVDTGFRAGDEVSSFFDPLLAKLIAWGKSRDAATALMCEALAETRIAGIKTNVPTLLRAIEQPDFVRGRYTTDLLQKLS